MRAADIVTCVVLAAWFAIFAGAAIRVIKRWRAKPAPKPKFELAPLALSPDQIDDEWLLAMGDGADRIPMSACRRLEAKGLARVLLQSGGVRLTLMGFHRIGYLSATYRVRPSKALLT